MSRYRTSSYDLQSSMVRRGTSLQPPPSAYYAPGLQSGGSTGSTARARPSSAARGEHLAGLGTVPARTSARPSQPSGFRSSTSSKADLPPPLTLPGCEDIKLGSRAGRLGFRNLGNTCFMNAGLQCLSHLTPFAEYFLSEKYSGEINAANPRGMKGELARAFAELQKAMWFNKETESYDPKSMHEKLAGFAPHLFEGDQQDVQEFLAFCLDGLHEDLNRVTTKQSRRQARDEEAEQERIAEEISEEMAAAIAWHRHLEKDKSFIVDLLQGQLRSSVTCITCGHCSRRFDPFLYLSVPVTRQMSHLTDSLTKYQEEEMLTESEQWMCVKCNKPVDAKKRIQVWKLPPVLVLHLKRFETDRSTGSFRKITTMLSVPLELDLSSMCKSTQRHGATYKLVCAANHSGRYGRGHYAAICCLGGGQQLRQWIFIDDESIKEISAETAVSVASQYGYVLFYMRGPEGEEGEQPKLRRQTVSMPELWPHWVSKRNSMVSDVLPKLDQQSDGFGTLAAGDQSQSSLGSAGASDLSPERTGRRRRTEIVEAKLASLRVGDRVVALGKHHGYVRFIGTTSFSSGEWVGVELDEVVGKNDGSVQGVSYFKCKPMTGIFVRRSPQQLRSATTASQGTASNDPLSPLDADAWETKAGRAGSDDSCGFDLVGSSERREAPQAGSLPNAQDATDGEAGKKHSPTANEGSPFAHSKTSPAASGRKVAGAAEARKTFKGVEERMEEEEQMGQADSICVSNQAEMQEAIRECSAQVSRLQAVVQRLSASLPEAPSDMSQDRGADARRPCCRYAEKCYRTKNRQHNEEYCHPGDPDWDAKRAAADAAVLAPEHKAILDKLLLTASTRLGQRLAKRIQEPLDREIRVALGEALLKPTAAAAVTQESPQKKPAESKAAVQLQVPETPTPRSSFSSSSSSSSDSEEAKPREKKPAVAPKAAQAKQKSSRAVHMF